MTAEASGLVVSGRSRSRSLAGTPCAASASHMTGSQDTMAVRLTWRATQAAAWLRVIAAAVRAPVPTPRPVGGVALPVCPDRTIVSAPAAVSVRAEMITPVTCQRRPDAGRPLPLGWTAGRPDGAGLVPA